MTDTKTLMIKMGTTYGSWAIPDNILNENSIVYLVGAGEDISFDVCIIEKYGCEVNIFDPTPRAKKHIQELKERTENGEKMKINNKEEYYTLKKENIPLLKYTDIGLWDIEEDLKFYSPQNSEHVSHSALNLQKTEDYFIAKVKDLKTIMSENGHTKIDLLKIDIEGAEYKVIDSIIREKIDIKIFCVEFDEAYHQMDNMAFQRIVSYVNKIINFGYVIVDRDNNHNYTFVKK